MFDNHIAIKLGAVLLIGVLPSMSPPDCNMRSSEDCCVDRSNNTPPLSTKNNGPRQLRGVFFATRRSRKSLLVHAIMLACLDIHTCIHAWMRICAGQTSGQSPCRGSRHPGPSTADRYSPVLSRQQSTVPSQEVGTATLKQDSCLRRERAPGKERHPTGETGERAKGRDRGRGETEREKP